MGLLSRLTLVFLLAGAISCFAYTIEVINIDSARGGNVTFQVDGASYTGYAGAILGRFDGGPDTWTFFCIDLFTGISLGTFGTTPEAPTVGTPEERVAWLYVNQLSSVNTVNRGRGFQLAIWDIIHDGGDGPNAGRIRTLPGSTPTGAVTAWNNYLNLSLGQTSSDASAFRNFDIASGDLRQDFIGPYAHHEAPVPETSSWLLMGTTAGFLAWRRFRPRRGDPPQADVN